MEIYPQHVRFDVDNSDGRETTPERSQLVRPIGPFESEHGIHPPVPPVVSKDETDSKLPPLPSSDDLDHENFLVPVLGPSNPGQGSLMRVRNERDMWRTRYNELKYVISFSLDAYMRLYASSFH